MSISAVVISTFMKHAVPARIAAWPQKLDLGQGEPGDALFYPPQHGEPKRWEESLNGSHCLEHCCGINPLPLPLHTADC